MSTAGPEIPEGLTSTSYLVLGLVAGLERATSYDLKRFVGMSIGYFWSFPHSQLYAEPARLAGAGLLDVEEEEGGRRRRVYSVTDRGRAALDAWLADPAPELGEIRDPGLLKLFFGALATPAEMAALARNQADAYRHTMAAFDGIEAAIAGDPSFAYPLLTLRLGQRVNQACLSFWEELAAHQGKPPGPKR